jgi:hypothetical protein
MYLGKSLTVEDRTESAAMNRWRVTAEAIAAAPTQSG